MSPTLFTWGYFGWGNATAELVRLVDAVEEARGFLPPLFVDTRIRRAVRAAGFQGSNFEKLLGPGRHRWMPGLGNEFIRTRTGPTIQIADPAQAETLLDLTLEQRREGRRVIFFCGCQWPRQSGETSCHRDAVAGLVLEAALRRGESVEVVEWPGGSPGQAELEIPDPIFSAVSRGRASVPLGEELPAELGGLPWGSVVRLRGAEKEVRVLAGPARRYGGEWQLPVMEAFPDPEAPLAALQGRASSLRRELGLEARSAGG